MAPQGFTLNLRPQARLDLINVSNLVGDLLQGYRKAVYYSYHTTAGYLDEGICAKLEHEPQNLQAFVQSFQQLFPPGATYRHDDIEQREELSAEQKKGEPRNADAHLTFIGSGFTNCVTYRNAPRVPVFFIDLDGVNGEVRRRRQTTVIGFDREKTVDQTLIRVPVSSHPVDSVNLKSPQLGLFEQLREWIGSHGVARGKITVSLEGEEDKAGLTVNEFETFLMRHDLAEVLRNPLRFVAERGRHMLQNPWTIPLKAKGYAKYDFVQILNEFFDSMGLSESFLERIVQRFLAFPASRLLRMKRTVHLLVSDELDPGRGEIVQGTYQSPILLQWGKARNQTRRLRATLVRFD